ncbi:MAG: 30S ribosomal protein S6 [Candidatus Parcubacteria bacterium]|nr:30S ribosomal protein S6 [Candidatus Parcubacteria bacterium]
MTKNYQLVCLVSALTEPTEREQITERINHLIQEGEGKVSTINSPEERTLGYPVKKEKGAVLLALDFSYDGEKMPELQKKITSENQILRYFLKEIPKHKPYVPSARKSLFKKAETEEKESIIENTTDKISGKEQKVELKDIDKKIEEIFNTKENEFK